MIFLYSIPNFIAPDGIACYIKGLTRILYYHTGNDAHLFAYLPTAMLPAGAVKVQVFPYKILKGYDILKALRLNGVYICGLAENPFIFMNDVLCCFIPMIAVQVCYD